MKDYRTRTKNGKMRQNQAMDESSASTSPHKSGSPGLVVINRERLYCSHQFYHLNSFPITNMIYLKHDHTIAKNQSLHFPFPDQEVRILSSKKAPFPPTATKELGTFFHPSQQKIYEPSRAKTKAADTKSSKQSPLALQKIAQFSHTSVNPTSAASQTRPKPLWGVGMGMGRGMEYWFGYVCLE